MLALAGGRFAGAGRWPTCQAKPRRRRSPPPKEKAVEEPAPAKPVEVPQAKTPPRKPLPSEAAAKGQAVPAEKPAAGPDPFAGGSESQLTFQRAG